MKNRQLCRTYLAHDGSALLGYYTIGLKCTTIKDTASFSKKFRSKLGINPKNDVAQCFLLAQVCRSDTSQKGFGMKLIREAINLIREANLLVGCRLIRLDCTDEMVDYYRNLGFVAVRYDADDGLNQMIYAM